MGRLGTGLGYGTPPLGYSNGSGRAMSRTDEDAHHEESDDGFAHGSADGRGAAIASNAGYGDGYGMGRREQSPSPAPMTARLARFMRGA